MRKNIDIDPAEVKRQFDYLPGTGRLVRRYTVTNGKAGKLIGRVNKGDGERRTKSYRNAPFKGKNFQTAWLVWAWHKGEFPYGGLVHINGDTLDDRVENLELRKNLRRPVPVSHDLPEEDQPDTMIGDLPDVLNTGIYEIRNIKNGRKYIGSAVNVSKRWRQHLKGLEEGKHHSRFMQRCWNKNGGENFIFRVIVACSVENLIMYEQAAIDAMQPEYNSASVAGSQMGVKFSAESRAKCAAAARRTKNFTGKTHSEESRKKISEAKKGKKQSPCAVKRRADAIRRLKGRHSAKKFTEDQVREIRKRCAAGEKNIVLAKEYGVSDSVICEIKKGRAYRWVE